MSVRRNSGLYKNRYLIAVYEPRSNGERLLNVFDNPDELEKSGIMAVRSFYHAVSVGSKNIALIDVLSVTDDIFKEEDEIFIKFAKDNGLITKTAKERVQEICDELHCSVRTYYRRKNSVKGGKNDRRHL